MHFFAYCLSRTFKCRFALQDESQSLRLMATHCADDRKSISWMAAVQVRDKNIELALSNQAQGFSRGSGGSHFEAIGFKQRRKSQSGAVFIIDEQNSRRIAHWGPKHTS